MSAAGLVTLAACVAGCGAGGVAVSPPAPTGAVAADCRAVVAALPADLVIGGHPDRTRPVSPYTAAFGSPAVTVRCGAPLGTVDPEATVEVVNGIQWLPVGDETDAEQYVAWKSPTLLEVRIPHAYLPANVLPALAPLLARYGQSDD